MDCINLTTRKFLKGNYLTTQCLPLCPLECNRTGFSPSISFSQLNGDRFMSSIQSNANLSIDFVTKPINADNVKNSIVMVNLYELIFLFYLICFLTFDILNFFLRPDFQRALGLSLVFSFF